jgi:transcription elongation factor GreA-like protein
VTEKKHCVEVLRALLKMQQQQHEPDDEYIKGLRQRLKGAQKQLESMLRF